MYSSQKHSWSKYLAIMYIVATLRCNVAEGSLLAFFRCVITAPDCSVAKCNATSGGVFVKIIGEHLFLQSKYRSGRARLTCFYQKSDEITGQMAPRLCLICTFVCAIYFFAEICSKKNWKSYFARGGN